MAEFKASFSGARPAPAEAAWVHAYLHRVEGDLGNAGYWYRRAARPVAAGSLETEWERIASDLLLGKGV